MSESKRPRVWQPKGVQLVSHKVAGNYIFHFLRQARSKLTGACLFCFPFDWGFYPYPQEAPAWGMRHPTLLLELTSQSFPWMPLRCHLRP